MAPVLVDVEVHDSLPRAAIATNTHEYTFAGLAKLAITFFKNVAFCGLNQCERAEVLICQVGYSASLPEEALWEAVVAVVGPALQSTLRSSWSAARRTAVRSAKELNR